MQDRKVFAINPGSTSTKVALFEGDKKVFSQNITHTADELQAFASISDQLPYRIKAITDALEAVGVSLEGVDAFVGRGGGTATIVGGVYQVNDLMIEDVRSGKVARHPANLGCQIAREFSRTYGGEAFVLNTPSTDEFQDLARLTGIKGVYRHCYVHCLNQKEVAIRFAESVGKRYDEVNVVCAHIGGGISIVVHRHGQMVDGNDCLRGDGPMAPTRTGSLPVRDVISMCFSGKFTEAEAYELMTKHGGIVSHLGTSDMIEVMKMVEAGDAYARLVVDGMCYQIAKEIGAMSVVLAGKVDAILLTGGIAYSDYVVKRISELVGFLAPVRVYAGEYEMEGLASGAIRALDGTEQVREYDGVPVWDGFEGVVTPEWVI